MSNQNKKAIAQIVKHISRGCCYMQLEDARHQLENQIEQYIEEGADAAVLKTRFAAALNCQSRPTFFAHVMAVL